MREGFAGRTAAAERPVTVVLHSRTVVGVPRTMRAGALDAPVRNEHVQALDGLRGVALLLVFCHHAAYTYPPTTLLHPGWATSAVRHVLANGWAGVDVFFVLSGYLITTILLRSRTAENYYSVFYGRRVLRIAPVYYAVLVFVLLLPWPQMVQSQHAGWQTQMWWWLNCSNVPSALRPEGLFMLSPFWSLAVEEQFYLVWPVVVRRLTDRVLLRLSLGLVALEVVLRVLPPVLRLTHRFPEVIYRWTPFHCDGLLLGSALAIALATGVLRREALPALRWIAVGMAGAAAAMLWAGVRFYTTPVIALCVAAVVGVLVLQEGQGVMSRVLAVAPLRRVGRYSYCMYATQVLMLKVYQLYGAPHVHLRQGWPHFVGSYAGAGLLLFGVGAVSWAMAEGPLNALKWKLPYRTAAVEPVETPLEVQPAATLAA